MILGSGTTFILILFIIQKVTPAIDNDTSPTAFILVVNQLRMATEYITMSAMLACVFLFLFKLKQVEI